jgi:hypothetical protein
MSEISAMIPEWVFNAIILISVPTAICYVVLRYVRH